MRSYVPESEGNSSMDIPVHSSAMQCKYGVMNEANAKSMMRKTEDDTLTNVAIGVGALVIGVVTYMAIR